MAFLTIAGIDIACEKFSKGAPRLVGTAEPAFAGNLRNGIRATKRTWNGKSIALDTTTYANFLAAIANGAIVTVTGDALQGASVSCQVFEQGADTSTTGTLTAGYNFLWNVSFNIAEV